MGELIFLTKFLSWIYSKGEFIRFEKEIINPDPIISLKIPVELRCFTREPESNIEWGLDRVIKTRGIHGLRKFRSRWKKRNVMMGAYVFGDLAAFLWLGKRTCCYFQERKCAFLMDGYTFEEYRGNGLLPFLEVTLTKYCRENFREITNIEFFVKVNNTSSLRGSSKSGFSHNTSVTVLKILGQELVIHNRKRY